jgi:5-methylcytosine-specific restriction endonuclease McrA
MSKHWKPEAASKVEQLRARDGDQCWLCGKRMNFKATPNSSKAWSLEHLLSQSAGGPDVLDNLVLCHPPCNRILANRPLKDKIRLRERRRRKLWIASQRSQLRDALHTHEKRKAKERGIKVGITAGSK